ncbi:MAG: hypothetical protein K6B40_05075 [Firmicutes bacterium]|nr:hypothetical protein [Bacillota bacterium]
MEDFNEDTISLLKECNAGVKMGVNSIAEVIDHVRDERFRAMLNRSKEEHQKIGSEIHRLLNQCGESGKEPNPMAKSMSWLKTNIKMTMDESDATVADVTTDGCNMGVKSLRRYLNQYQNADGRSRRLTEELIRVEQQMTTDMAAYL